MKLKIVLHANGQDSKVYLLKPWRRSSSGYLWQELFTAPLAEANTRANNLARFLHCKPVLDAVTLSAAPVAR